MKLALEQGAVAGVALQGRKVRAVGGVAEIAAKGRGDGRAPPGGGAGGASDAGRFIL